MGKNKESQGKKKERAKAILELLADHYPDAHCALHHKNAFELLVATILSAQCTDERVNLVTPQLFKKYSNAKKMSQAALLDLERLIHSTGFYKNKAKNIKACAEKLVEKYHGEVPNIMEELCELPGVGRKTANVILGNIFSLPGLVVDTHVMRVSNRLDLARGIDAVKLEKDLQIVIPESQWTIYSHYIITHGRSVCTARKPDCKNCFLNHLCPQLIQEYDALKS